MQVPTGKHLRLTKTQRETAEGLELIQLLQTITQDGKFDAPEVIELTKWIKRNRESPLPAISFLADTVEAIIADGKVTREEQETLYKAVERVLPSDLTSIAKGNRLEIRERNKEIAEVEEAAGQERQEQANEKLRAERILNKKRGHYNFMVAGTRFEDRPERILAHAEVGREVIVIREPKNQHSRNACRLYITEGMVEIGYVPECDGQGVTHAADLAAELDSGCKYQASIYRVLTGGYSPIPIVIVATFGQDATLPGLRVRSESTQCGGLTSYCSVRLVLYLVIVSLVMAILVVAIRK